MVKLEARVFEDDYEYKIRVLNAKGFYMEEGEILFPTMLLASSKENFPTKEDFERYVMDNYHSKIVDAFESFNK